MNPIDSNEFMKNLTEKSDEELVEMARQGREAYLEGLYDCIIGELNKRRLDSGLLKEQEIGEEETAEGFLNTADYETIAVFDMPGVVKIYQESLEQEGIKTFVPNDYAPFDSQFCYVPNAIDRGIKLQVAKQDEKRAIEILSEDPVCQKYIVYNNDRTEEFKISEILKQAIRNWWLVLILFVALAAGGYVMVVIVAAAVFTIKRKLGRGIK